MANVKIYDLTEKTTAADTDELEIQETANGTSKKITRANLIPDSSETVKGKVELATTAEATTGTDTARAVTPAGVKAVADTKANTSHTHAEADITDLSLAINDLSDVTITTPSSGQVIKYNGSAWINDTDATGAGAANLFETIAADSGTSPVADTATDTLTIAGGTGIDTVGDATTDTVTISIDASVETTSGAQTKVDTHVNDTTDAHAASAITNTPAGNIAATTVQAALNELDTDKAAASHAHAAADTTSGTFDIARIPTGTTGTTVSLGDHTHAASGGQTLVTRIVAASGGDHTTLGAALTAASAGDTIYVRNGTYSEGAITSALADLTIVGESREKTIISMTTNALSLTGARVTLKNIQINATSGQQSYTGINQHIENCTLKTTGAAGAIQITGTDTAVHYNDIFLNHTSSFRIFYITSTNLKMTNNYIYCATESGTAAQGIVELGAANQQFVNNYFYVAAGTSGRPILGVGNANGGQYAYVSNNQFLNNATSAGIKVGSNATGANVSYNHIHNGQGRMIEVDASNCKVTGNRMYTSTNNAANYGVYVGSGNDVMVNANQFNGQGTTSAAGIFIAGGNNHQISGNKVLTFATGVVVNSSSSVNVSISDNSLLDSTTAITDNGTATNITVNTGVSPLLEKRYLRMKNTSGGSLAAGDVVVFKAVAAGDEVATTTSAGDSKVFGMAEQAILNNAYGYIQVLGKTTKLKVDGTTDIAIGDYLSTFTTAGIAQKAAAGHMAFAIALEAYTTDDSLGVVDALIVTPRLI